MTLVCDRLKKTMEHRRRSPSEFTWNDEAIEFARKCHTDGLSATEAAARLNDKFGGHLTRDAVCGRWWRMGLKGVANLANRQVAAVRAKRRADEHRETKKAQRAAKRIALGIPPPALNYDKALTATTMEGALVPQQQHRVGLGDVLKPIDAIGFGVIGLDLALFVLATQLQLILGELKQLHELTNTTCRWPYGDPGTPDFFFCGTDGANLESNRPYCPHHMEIAGAPVRKYSKGDISFLSMLGR